ncbi:MAG: DUF1508 domain-containing protein [Mycobacterium sp.]|nr:DUF1508 domain-containing protein [Mycobacterium sp.]
MPSCGEVPHAAGKFEVYIDVAGKYRFRLKAGNGEITPVAEARSSSRIRCWTWIPPD